MGPIASIWDDPADRCLEIGDYVSAVCDLGAKVSIDSFDPLEVEDAVGAGASLVLLELYQSRESFRLGL